MKIAIIGSRSLRLDNIGTYLPGGITEIVSGGAKGIDSIAAAYARQHDILLIEFLPDYQRYGRGAPIKRDQQIAAYADEAIAFWDGKSKGTMHWGVLQRTIFTYRQDKQKPMIDFLRFLCYNRGKVYVQ